MTKYRIFLTSTVILTSFTVLMAQAPAEPSGRRLRSIVADKYPGDSVIIGGTTGSWAFGTGTGSILDREFSYVTPENDFKQWNIHPDPNTWNWVQPDAWLDHIVEHGQVLRMHCPISPQCSNWAQTDTRTAYELEMVMREFMQAVCERYNGRQGIAYMDVVNETVQGGDWKKDEAGTGGWEVPWYRIGPDTDANKTPLYIRYAFEIAKQYAPDIKFIYNHHEDPASVESWNLIKSTIGYLRNLGLRVDGIGWQAHVDNGWATQANLDKLGNLIDWAHEHDLEFHVTEASVWINGDHSEPAFQEQATTYGKILQAVLDKRSTGVVGWNTWHIDDGHGWQTELAPSLFDEEYEAKPAYFAIQEVLENAPAGTMDVPQPDEHTSRLQKNFPNPFRESTSIAYNIEKRTKVDVSVFNTTGRKITTLVNEEKPAGHYETGWNGKNDAGGPVPPGIYFCRIRAGNFIRSCKMILQK